MHSHFPFKKIGPVNCEISMHTVPPAIEVTFITTTWHLGETNFFFFFTMLCHCFKAGYLIQKMIQFCKEDKIQYYMQDGGVFIPVVYSKKGNHRRF